MRSIAAMIVSIGLIAAVAGCGRAPSGESTAPPDNEAGACYHPSDGRIYDTEDECAKHNGTWGRAPG
jgi:hypothetical protein